MSDSSLAKLQAAVIGATAVSRGGAEWARLHEVSLFVTGAQVEELSAIEVFRSQP